MKTLLLLLIPALGLSQFNYDPSVYVEIQDTVITKHYEYDAFAGGLFIDDNGNHIYIANAPKHSFSETDSVRVKRLYYFEAKQSDKKCPPNIMCFQPISYEKVYLNIETTKILKK